MSDELRIAIEAAKAGAKKALTYFNTGLSIKFKKDGTPITIADRETEKTIIDYINSRLPSSKFLAEESGGSISEDSLWIIDPIDGTRSFIRGVPTWCVIISLSRRKEIVLAVIYYPLSKTAYYSEKGKGSFRNDKKIHVSKVNDISKSYLGYGSIKHFDDKQHLIKLTDAVGSARSWEATYSSCLVAEGKMDISVDSYGKVWNLAPFKLLIEEAGGEITRLNGDEWTLEGSGAVMTNGIFHEEVIKILNKK